MKLRIGISLVDIIVALLAIVIPSNGLTDDDGTALLDDNAVDILLDDA